MNLTDELRHYVSDAQATTIFVPQDLFHHVQPLLNEGLHEAPEQRRLAPRHRRHLQRLPDRAH